MLHRFVQKLDDYLAKVVNINAFNSIYKHENLQNEF